MRGPKRPEAEELFPAIMEINVDSSNYVRVKLEDENKQDHNTPMAKDQNDRIY